MKLLKNNSMYMIAGIACVGLLGFCGGCNKESKAPEKTESQKTTDTAVVHVVASDIVETEFEDWGSFSADLRGVEDVTLSAPAQGGKVLALKAVGAHVAAGESLYDIDGEKYEAILDAAKAQVDLTQADLERARSNVEKGSLGKSAVDGAYLAYQNARVNLVNAKRAYDDSRGIAPFSGILVSRSIDKYQTVSPGMPTVRLSKIDRLEATIAIPESEAFSYEEGMKTEFNLLQQPDKKFYGTLTNLDRAVDTRSRTVMARITIANANGLLKPGMVGRAQILRKKYQNAIVVPSSALLRMQNSISAMIVENNIARQKTVTIGGTNGDSTLVYSGIKAGDKLVVTGAFQVSDGTKVIF